MTDEEMVSPQEVKNIAQRVLAIERTVLRRTWGLLYAIIAVELILRLLLPIAGSVLGSQLVVSFSGNLIFQSVISLLGLVVSILIFKRVYSLSFVRRSIFSSFWTRPLWQLVIFAFVIFALALAGLIAALLFLRANFATILFGLAAAQTPWLYYSLKVSFPEGTPPEGMASILAFGLASVGTTMVTMSAFVGNAIPYLSLWGVAVVVFILAFLHSLSIRLPEPPSELT